MADQKIVIAIDGYSGCGKSSTAKVVARNLGYTYIDSGAMYRAVTLYFLRHDVSLENDTQVNEALSNLVLSFEKKQEDSTHMYLNGEDVEAEIRGMQVSSHVSAVSALQAVRKAMVAQQQAMGMQKGIVMDGRDIGTYVFPEAELKIFMTAEPKVRAQRRREELLQKGQDVSVGDIIENLLERDKIDTERKENPLRKAAQAIEIDTSYLTFEQQVEKILMLAREAIQS